MNRTPLPDALARLLGQTTAEARLDSPATTPQMALAPMVTAAMDPLADPLSGLGIPVPVPLEGAPFRLARLPDDPLRFVLESSGSFTILRGEVREARHDLVVVDSRAAPTSLREADWVLDLDQGRARAWRLDGAQEDQALRLPAEGPPVGLGAPAWPGTDALLGGVGCPAWLRRRADELGASPDPLDPLCAAGLLLRLWSPTSAAERAMALERARAGTPWLLPALRGWLGQAVEGAPVDWSAVELATVERAELLLGLLADLVDLQARDLALARATASRVVAGRDDLESLRMILAAMRGPRQALEAALEELDEAAVVHSLVLSDLLFLEATDPWLNAVASCEPDAWWGGLVR
ncbi:hypothetical protein L6R53_00850 [Myxococcota bacterium]|nr:hypothetical protein [Myxococcota bacterium]